MLLLVFSIYSPLNWLKSLFFIDALMLQNLLFFASQISAFQYSCCVTPSGIANFVIMIWHMLCGWSLNIVHFCGSILLHGQIVWCMMCLILLILHSSWLSIAFFSFFALHSSLVAPIPLSSQIMPCWIPSIVVATFEWACLALQL
jgi:hypothetical protein